MSKWGKRSIVIDIDGVLSDFVLGFTRWAHDNLNEAIATMPSRFHQQWSFDGVMSSQESSYTWRHINENPGWWGTLPPLVGGDIGRRLNILSLKAPIYFVTHRPDDAQGITAAWLRREIGIDLPTVILSKKKGDVARLLNATHAIDDKLENALCLHWISDQPQTKVYILDRPYNQDDRIVHVAGHPGITRVREFIEFLDDLERAYL